MQNNNNVTSIGPTNLALITGFMTYLIMHGAMFKKGSGDDVELSFDGEVLGLKTDESLSVDLLGDRLVKAYHGTNAAVGNITAAQFGLLKGLVGFLASRSFAFEKATNDNWVATFTGEYPGLKTGEALTVNQIADRIVKGYDQIAAKVAA